MRVGIASDVFGGVGHELLPGMIDDVFGELGLRPVRLSAERDDWTHALDGLDGLIFEHSAPPVEDVVRSGSVRVIGRLAAGYDDVPVAEFARAGIAYLNTPTAYSEAVAQAALTLMLTVAGRLPERQRLMRQGDQGWKCGAALIGTSLFGKTLGILGPGAIGQAVFRLTAPFRMRRIATGARVLPNLAAEFEFTYVDIDTLCREADLLVLSCPLNDRTRGLIDARRVGLLKPDAILVNVARGAILDEAALVNALNRGAVAGAGLDTFSQEPTAWDNPLLHSDRVVASPHGLAITSDGYRRALFEVAQGMKAFLAGGQPNNLVTHSSS
jgi:phosphoglycerate dehydrogenase-like enzyme